MAVDRVIVSIVDIGQGQCTFVEMFDQSQAKPLVHTLLFDCGSDKNSSQTRVNLDYIVTSVLTMNQPGFDCIFFSHSDKDHVSKMRYVLDKIALTTPPVIGKVVYGGDVNKYTKGKNNRAFNILSYIYNRGYCALANFINPVSNFTNYYPFFNTYLGDLWANADNTVIVRCLAGNVVSANPDWTSHPPVDQRDSAEVLNRVSLVTGLYFAGKSYVICGDATHETMSAIVQLFRPDTTVFNSNVMTTLPHHGARYTGLAVASGKPASAISINNVQCFSALLKSFTLTVSAYRKHAHPSLELMSYFPPGIVTPILRDSRLAQNNAHFITANIDYNIPYFSSAASVVKGNDQSFESLTNTFTTNYYIAGGLFGYRLGQPNAYVFGGFTQPPQAINNFGCWRYTTLLNGTTTLGGYPNLSLPSFTAAPLAPPAPVVRAMHPPLVVAEEPPQLKDVTEELLPLFRVKPKQQAAHCQPITNPSFPSRLKQYH